MLSDGILNVIILRVFMQRAVRLSVVMLCDGILNVVILGVIVLRAVMLNVALKVLFY
jgi:hypothetical protein